MISFYKGNGGRYGALSSGVLHTSVIEAERGSLIRPNPTTKSAVAVFVWVCCLVHLFFIPFAARETTW